MPAGRYDLCEPENRLVARELETRWNAKLRLVTELEEEYRREQRRGLTPLSEAEHALLRALVTDLPTLWSAPATTAEERKRLVRCLVREVVLDRGAGANGAGGSTTLRIGWKSGAWTELRVRRPSTADSARTPEAVLGAHPRQRRAVARRPDRRAAQCRRRDDPPGLAVDGGAGRADSAVPSDPHRVPHDADGAAQRRAATGRWARVRGRSRGAPGGRSECREPLAEVGLPARRAARSRRPAVGPAHARGHRSARRDAGGPGPRPVAAPRGPPRVGRHPEQLWDKARQGEVIAYRARVADHWEWRVSPADADAPVTAGDRAMLM